MAGANNGRKSELKTGRSGKVRGRWTIIDSSGGSLLQTLLQLADYPTSAQLRHLEFYRNCITKQLGVRRDSLAENPWQSFMTDDGFPIEFSWQWSSGNTSPSIRYSVEPIGLLAGTKADPHNRHGSREMEQALRHTLEGADYQWLDYFRAFFDTSTKIESEQYADHTSHVFFAFDLLEISIKGKDYFFPRYKADDLKIAPMEAISIAIRRAPHIGDYLMQAFIMFERFALKKSIEPEMFAIDLVDPSRSRIKIYFRLRDNRLSSVVEVAALGRKQRSPSTELGLKNLRLLWRLLFDVDDSKDPALSPSDHCTAGVLYYAEFRNGIAFPSIKIYAPVRHYSRSDEAILQALVSYFDVAEDSGYAERYTQAMRTSFPRDCLGETGIHTYIGIAINDTGSLRITSYLNPRTANMSVGAP